MHESTFTSAHLVMLDGMIARAEASCERGRVTLERVGRGKRPVSRTSRARLQTMEETLARLQAERERLVCRGAIAP